VTKWLMHSFMKDAAGSILRLFLSIKIDNVTNCIQSEVPHV